LKFLKEFKSRFLFTSDKNKNIKKNARPYEIYYDDKKNGSEIENIIEINENIVDKNFFEINKYYADKIRKYCRNCNSIFELENKLYQCLRNCKANDSTRVTKIKTKSTIIIPGKNIFILKFLKKFKFDSGNYFRIFYYAIIKILLN
jgi:hypothetical protein